MGKVLFSHLLITLKDRYINRNRSRNRNRNRSRNRNITIIIILYYV